MKIREYEPRELKLSQYNQLLVTIMVLQSVIYPGEFISEWNDKQMLCQADPEWRHGTVDTIPVREATTQDIEVVKLIAELQERLKTAQRIP